MKSVCAEPVSPDMKAATEQTGNQHDNNDNNTMVRMMIKQLITTRVVMVAKLIIAIIRMVVTS